MADEAVLVHDIAPPHPRYAQFARMTAEVAAKPQGMLTIAVNPGGKVAESTAYIDWLDPYVQVGLVDLNALTS